jgi:two-component system NtrC family sensor kinase
MPELAAGEAQLRILLDNIPARVALLDRERRHRYVNQEYIQFAGRPLEEILGRTVAEITGAESFAGLKGLSDRALAGETARWEGWMPHHDTGESRFVQRFYVPHRAPDGGIDGYFTLTLDLTELKRVEQRLIEQVEALHASEALAAAITAAALDCVVVINEAGLVEEFNAAAVSTFGYTRDEAIGRPMAELIIPPTHRAAHVAGFQGYLAHGGSRMLGRRIEMEALRADGSIFPAELAVTEVKLPERRLFAAYLRDLTAAKQAEAQIRRQREALHEVEKMAVFGTLLAGVAHELNNPLSIVIGHAVLLEEEAHEQGAAAVVDRAEKIRVAAERCGQTVRTFLAMARQRGRRREPVSVDRLLRAALRLLQDHTAAGAIGVRWDAAGKLPAVLGDPDQLHHVFANLVLNAQQALVGVGEPGCVTITAAVSGGVLEIGVADNGPGVPYDIRGRIFDPFFTTKKPGAGTGIGLAVSRGIAESHGGTLTLDASHQNGARFVLRLPLAEKPTGVPGPSADHLALGDFFWSPPQHETGDKTVPRGS